MNVRPKIMDDVLTHCSTGLYPNAASGSFPKSSTVGISAERQRVARSTVQAVEYLIKQNDPKRLRTFLAKHTRAERLAIKRQLERDK